MKSSIILPVQTISAMLILQHGPEANTWSCNDGIFVVSNKRKCKYHKEYFLKDDMIKCNIGWFKDIDSMAAFGKLKSKKDREKKTTQEHSKRKKALRDGDRKFQLKKTQEIFNRFVRARDKDRPCISCNRHHSGQYHAGHYRTVGGNPELRFNPDNCHKQCSACNNYLSGNVVNYRINLIKKIGVDAVNDLEGPHNIKKYTLENLKELQNFYTIKTKEITTEI